jgi:hypothetical protein
MLLKMCLLIRCCALDTCSTVSSAALNPYNAAYSFCSVVCLAAHSKPELAHFVDFKEESPDGTVVTQKWPVVPYQVRFISYAYNTCPY